MADDFVDRNAAWECNTSFELLWFLITKDLKQFGINEIINSSTNSWDISISNAELDGFSESGYRKIKMCVRKWISLKWCNSTKTLHCGRRVFFSYLKLLWAWDWSQSHREWLLTLANFSSSLVFIKDSWYINEWLVIEILFFVSGAFNFLWLMF